MKKYSEFDVMDSETADDVYIISEYSYLLGWKDREEIIEKINAIRVQRITDYLTSYKDRPSFIMTIYHRKDNVLKFGLRGGCDLHISIDLNDLQAKELVEIAGVGGVTPTQLSQTVDWINDTLNRRNEPVEEDDSCKLKEVKENY